MVEGAMKVLEHHPKNDMYIVSVSRVLAFHTTSAFMVHEPCLGADEQMLSL